VERIWRAEGLKVAAQQSKREPLWLNNGSNVRLAPERVNRVWSYDFVEDRTRDGRKFHKLNAVDEFSRECLTIRVACRLSSAEVIDVLADLFITRGTPGFICSNDEPNCTAQMVKFEKAVLEPEPHTSSPAALATTGTWKTDGRYWLAIVT
jgi:putative transposase